MDPQKINSILVSHGHPDHYNDAEVLIEAMTRGMTKKRGVLAAASSVLKGNSQCEAAISKYHQTMPKEIFEAKPGTFFNLNQIRVTVAQAKHTDPDTVGFRFEIPNLGDVAYTSDTEYFAGIGKPYQGIRLLLLCVMRPTGSPWKGHMTSQDAIQILNDVQPEMAVLTHFGMKMIFKGPDLEANNIQEKTGIPTIAGSDRMHIIVGEKIRMRTYKRKQLGLDEFGET